MNRAVVPFFAVIAFIIAGCSAGGGGLTTPSVSPTSSPTSIPIGPSPTMIVLHGGGYTLSFLEPAITSGNATTGNAVLQLGLPSGVPAPSFARPVGSAISHGKVGLPRIPSTLGTSITDLVYLMLTPAANFTTGSTPSFTYTLPSGITLPPGSSTYVLFYDPTQSASGWIPVLGPGVVSGQTISFPGINTSDSFTAGQQYIYALVVASQVVPTATPNASPTPSGPGVACTTEGISPSNGDTVNITDSSNLPGGSMLLVYVYQGSTQALGGPPGLYPNGAWMDAHGNFTNGNSAIPLPASCYSSTLNSGVANNPLVIPTGYFGRIYLVYVNKPKSSTIPNPIGGSQPPSDIEPYLYDKVEFGTQTGPSARPVIDTTQVDFLGLPIELQLVASTTATPLPASTVAACSSPMPTSPPSPIPTAGSIVGFTQCGFAAAFQTIINDPTGTYGSLVTNAAWAPGQASVNFRALSPLGASQATSSFDQNYFADPSVKAPSGCNSSTPAWTQFGIIGCLLNAYATNGEVYTSQIPGTNGDGDYFCITSDNAANFIATDIGTATACGSPAKPTSTNLPVNPFKIPAVVFTNATVPAPNPANGACEYDIVFQAPFGLAYVEGTNSARTGLAFGTQDAFALWKAMVLELNYGSAFSSGTHPLESTPPLLQNGVFGSPISNYYARALHSFADGTYSYALSYDDGFSWQSGYVMIPPGTINVRINPVPTAAPYTPSGSAPATPTCGTFTQDIGSY